jgi:hypothetical protein
MAVSVPASVISVQASSLFPGSPFAPSATGSWDADDWLIGFTQNLGGSCTAFSVGGNSFTRLSGSDATFAGDGATWQASIWLWRASSGGGPSSLSVSHDANAYEIRAFVYKVTGGHATQLVAASSMATDGSTGGGLTAMPLTLPAGGDLTNNRKIVFCAYGNSTDTATVNSPWSETYDAVSSAFFDSSVYVATAQSDTQPTVTSNVNPPSHGYAITGFDMVAGVTAITLTFAGSPSGNRSGIVVPVLANLHRGVRSSARTGAGLIVPASALAGSKSTARSGALAPSVLAVAAPVRSGERPGALLTSLREAFAGSQTAERDGAVTFGVVAVGVGAGSRSTERSGAGGAGTLGAAGAGSRSSAKQSAASVAPAPTAAGSKGAARSGAASAALAPTAAGVRSAFRSGAQTVLLPWTQAGTRTAERDGAIAFGVTTSGVGAGSKSTERSGASGPSTLGAVGAGSKSTAKAGAETLGFSPGVGSGSKTAERDGAIAFGVTTVGVGAGSKTTERSGAAGPTGLALTAAGSRSAQASGLLSAAHAVLLKGTPSTARNGAGLLALAPRGASVLTAEDSGGQIVAATWQVKGSPSGAKSGRGEVWEVVVFGVGAGSPSQQASGASTIEVVVVGNVASYVMQLAPENRLVYATKQGSNVITLSP